jgi:hypothetical protein
MAEVIPIALPFMQFDIDEESQTAAVNEACAGEGVECTLGSLCPECSALANAIAIRLQKAFLAGQASMQTSGD